MSKGPLAGIKVVEMAGIGPAPCAGMMLADMGAEVILIDRKVANANAANLGTGDDPNQSFFNRGKKSLAVNLKSAEGIEAVLKLIDSADVLLEGFRPGVMERLGLGPEVCHARNPKLVYGRMTGWGQTGPLAHAAGHDPNYIGVSGALYYGGRENHPPTAPLTLVGDLGGGTMVLAWGVICAVLDAQRNGKGQVVDAAITDGSAYISSLLMLMRNTGQIRDDKLQTGWADGAAPWNDTYQCADGNYITVCPLEPGFYKLFLDKLGLADNPAFADQWDAASWPEGRRILTELFAGKTREQWCEELEGTDVCFGPVLSFAEAAEHPHNKARGTFLEINGVPQPAPAPKLSGYTPDIKPCPEIGAHSDEVLTGAGMDAAAIAQLKELGVI
ncbi:CaiB/BaiF CoA-transferase family protein [Pseudomaricurvus sp. HS19]|uniref:CaiB/BaiF CoA transferase family protein n=1 Tax=Pseudomaricurvus sp. HS19 TaxID=2692626 RepID=UPI00136F32DB|nr:CaiB/BaiF CoA-transferase family protein [Pseudomaricurvus sp. HS19]MYM61846.1 CoA transferase [Pseudomaricurvus sp. HS19]